MGLRYWIMNVSFDQVMAIIAGVALSVRVL